MQVIGRNTLHAAHFLLNGLNAHPNFGQHICTKHATNIASVIFKRQDMKSSVF